MSHQEKCFTIKPASELTLSKRNQHLCPCNGLNAVRCFHGRSGLIAATFTAAFDDRRCHISPIKATLRWLLFEYQDVDSLQPGMLILCCSY